MAAQLPKRTNNEIKNYWNTHLKKRLAKIGFDPVTHKPKTAILASANGDDPKNLSNLSHIAQWETARLQAEARFERQSKLLISYDEQPIPAPPVPQYCRLDMNRRAPETLLMLKSIFSVDGGVGNVGQEVGSFGNINVEGLLRHCDQVEAPRTTSSLDFNEVLGGYGTNGSMW